MIFFGVCQQQILKGGEKMSGAEIKEKIKSANIKLWQVAHAFGVTDATFSRKLRFDFNESDTQKVLAIIKELRQ